MQLEHSLFFALIYLMWICNLEFLRLKQMPTLSWIHTQMLSLFFPQHWAVSCCFHSDSMPPLSIKTLMRSVFRWPIESCVVCAKCSWCWHFTFFCQLSGITRMEWHYLNYQIEAHDLKNRNTLARERWKNTYSWSMNPALLYWYGDVVGNWIVWHGFWILRYWWQKS